MNIKAIIWDWAGTLWDYETKEIFSDSEEILKYCQTKDYKQTIVSLAVTEDDYDRTKSIEQSTLRKYFDIAEVTDTDKNLAYDNVVQKLNLQRDQVIIIDDRTIRGIKYANKNGHPSIWLQKGDFANELPNTDTGQPTYTVKSLEEIKNIL